MCDDYLKTFHKNEFKSILTDEDTTKHFSIHINFIVVYESQPDLVVDLFTDPEKCLAEWDNATIKAQMALLKEVDNKSSLKNNVHCRIYHLPGFSELLRTVFPGNDDAGKFLQVTGTVMRMSAVKLLEYQRSYICVKCKYSMLVKAEYEKKYIIKRPGKCGNPENCPGTNLITFGELDSENCKDYQEIKIQEQVKKLGFGSMPNTMWVTLEDDLVDCCKPGDNVTICGIVKRRWGEFCKGNKIDIDIVLKANNIQVHNTSSSVVASTPEVKEMFGTFWDKYSDNPLAGRDLILKSICPQIYGLYLVKLSIAIVLAGGSQTDDSLSTSIHTRSEPHLLLVGDPGTGKSHILRFASKIIPRSVLTTGVGSTAAGLTVTAIMEHGEWQLEGGALVMSDGGICCIDEFNSMKEHDRTSIHEAMEQQTISVAKASMVCKLNTRCSILAACNPKGNLDPTQPLSMNIALPSPLLSRFDLILLLRDQVNEEWDEQVADYILNGGAHLSKLTDTNHWNVDMLQSYFITIKKFNPKLSQNAEKILGSYYQMQRRIDSRNKARTTVRLLESLVRLSQGHARLMYHEKVETIDSIYAIVLIDTAMDSASSILDLNVNTLSIFPESPMREYYQVAEIILKKLRLDDVLDQEVSMLKTFRGFSENVRSRFFNMQRKSTENDNLNLREDENEIVQGKDNIDNNSTVSDGNNLDESHTPENVDSVGLVQIIEENVENNFTKNIAVVKENCQQKRTSKEQVRKISKRLKLITEESLETDLDEGYNTVSFGTAGSSTDKSIKPNKGNNSSSNIASNMQQNVTDAEDQIKCQDSTVSAISTTGNTSNEQASVVKLYGKEQASSENLDEGGRKLKEKLHTFKFVPKHLAVSGKGNEEKHASELEAVEADARSVNKNAKEELQEFGRVSKEVDVSKIPKISNNKNTSCLDSVEAEKNDVSHFGSEKVNTNNLKKMSVRDRLKKFKFIPKELREAQPETTTNTNISNNTDTFRINSLSKDINGFNKEDKENKKLALNNTSENREKNEKLVKELQTKLKSPEAETTNKETKNLNGKVRRKDKTKEVDNTLNDFINSDLEMLRLMPSVNDDFNIDLDFDWDNVDNFQESKSFKNKKTRSWSRNTTDDSTNTKSSKRSDGTSLIRSGSNFSSQSSKTNIFETDEHLDDLDLDI